MEIPLKKSYFLASSTEKGCVLGRCEVLFWPVQQLAARSLAKRLDAAVDGRDVQLLSRLLNEVGFGYF